MVEAALMVTTDAEIDAAFERSKAHDNDPLARTVRYVPLLKLLIIGLDDGRRIALPIEGVPELKKATKKVVGNWELLGAVGCPSWAMGKRACDEEAQTGKEQGRV